MNSPDRMSWSRLQAAYFVAMFASVVLGGLSFFWPIRQIYAARGEEFSNLGPIATAFWGFGFGMLVVTPCFVGLAVWKWALQGRRPWR